MFDFDLLNNEPEREKPESKTIGFEVDEDGEVIDPPEPEPESIDPIEHLNETRAQERGETNNHKKESKPTEWIDVSGQIPCFTCGKGLVPVQRTTIAPVVVRCRVCHSTLTRVRINHAGMELPGASAVKAVTKEQFTAIASTAPKERFDIHRVGKIWEDLFIVYVPTELTEYLDEANAGSNQNSVFYSRGLALRETVTKEEDLETLALSIRSSLEIQGALYAFLDGMIQGFREKKQEFGYAVFEELPDDTPKDATETKRRKTRVKNQAAKKSTAELKSVLLEGSGMSMSEMLEEMAKGGDDG